jgi:hypothetical protein
MISKPTASDHTLFGWIRRRWPLASSVLGAAVFVALLIKDWADLPRVLGDAAIWFDHRVEEQPWLVVASLLAAFGLAACAAGIWRFQLNAARERLQFVDYGLQIASLDAVRFETRHEEIVNARVEEIRAVLAQARKTVLVSGIANQLVTSRLGNSEELADFFARGGTLRAIFIDPTGEEARLREVREGHDPRMFELPLKSAMNIVALRLYRRVLTRANADKSPVDADYARLEIRVRDRVPPLNLLIVDDEWAAIHHYGTRSPGSVSPRITVNLLGLREADSSEPGQHVRVDESRAALKYYRADFEAQWEMADELPASPSWLDHTSDLTWSTLATIIVDGKLRLENPEEKGRVHRLQDALIQDYDRRMKSGTLLQVKQHEIDQARRNASELQSKLEDAIQLAKKKGDLDGVRLRLASVLHGCGGDTLPGCTKVPVL